MCTQGKGCFGDSLKRQLSRLWQRLSLKYFFRGKLFCKVFLFGFCFGGFFFFYMKHKYLISAHCGSSFCQLPLLISFLGLSSTRLCSCQGVLCTLWGQHLCAEQELLFGQGTLYSSGSKKRIQETLQKLFWVGLFGFKPKTIIRKIWGLDWRLCPVTGSPNRVFPRESASMENSYKKLS